MKGLCRRRWGPLAWAAWGAWLLSGCGSDSADELYHLGMEASQDTSRYAEAEAYFEGLLRRYPRDGRCTRALFLAAQMDVERGRYEKAIDRYDRILRDYPDPEICDKAQFMIGYTYAEHLAQYDVAQDAFAAVIDSYPGSDLVDDARWMIENMGKSPEELGLFDGAHAQSVDSADQ